MATSKSGLRWAGLLLSLFAGAIILLIAFISSYEQWTENRNQETNDTDRQVRVTPSDSLFTTDPLSQSAVDSLVSASSDTSLAPIDDSLSALMESRRRALVIQQNLYERYRSLGEARAQIQDSLYVLEQEARQDSIDASEEQTLTDLRQRLASIENQRDAIRQAANESDSMSVSVSSLFEEDEADGAGLMPSADLEALVLGFFQWAISYVFMVLGVLGGQLFSVAIQYGNDPLPPNWLSQAVSRGWTMAALIASPIVFFITLYPIIPELGLGVPVMLISFESGFFCLSIFEGYARKRYGTVNPILDQGEASSAEGDDQAGS